MEATHNNAVSPEALASNPGLLTKTQLAEKLGTTKRQVECLVAAKKIPVIRMGHRTARFSLPRVLAALEKLTTREI